MINVVVCDLDGSLMPVSSGLYVKEAIQKRLIQLQEQGKVVILNSARILQGVQPCGKQIQLSDFHGYIISCNGCHALDVATQETLFEYTIPKEEALKIWDICLKYGLNPAISQPEYMLCEDFVIGYQLDRNNCEVDYMVTRRPEYYIHQPIWKCCISETADKVQRSFEKVKQEIENTCHVKVIQSTPTLIDIVPKEADKVVALDRLLNMIGKTWEETTYIGDGTSDAACIENAKLGVTLENGKDACKQVCDLLVPSCDEDGCLVWLDQLLEEEICPL